MPASIPLAADHPLWGGPFTAAQAASAGVGQGRLRTLLRSREVRPVINGVYAASGLADSTTLRAAAAMLVLPEHGVVADRSAAWLHGIDAIDVVELDAVPALEVVSMTGHDRSRRAGLYGGKRDLLPTEVTSVAGVRVTTPLRTAADVATLRGRWRAIGVLDAFRRHHGLTHRDLVSVLPRFTGRRGVTQLRELIPLSTDEAHSQPESWVRLELHDHGLPMPSPQVRVPLPYGGFYLVENAWEHLRIAVEYDGAEFHSEAEDRQHDDDRRAVLTEELGWAVFVLRRSDLQVDQRERWLREIDAEFHDRAGLPRRRIYARSPDAHSYRWRRPRRY